MSKVSSLVVVLTLLCATSMLVYGKETVGVTSSTLKEIPTSTLMERKDTDSEYRVSGGDYGRSLKNDTRRKSAGQDDERSVSPENRSQEGHLGQYGEEYPPLDNRSKGQRAIQALNASLQHGNASNESIQARIRNIESIQNRSRERLNESLEKLDIKTKLKLNKVEGKLTFENKTLKVQPENLVPDDVKVEKAELVKDGERMAYKVRVKTQAKVLWIIPISVEETYDVDAETGEVKVFKRPWWSFLYSSSTIESYGKHLKESIGY